LNAELQEDDGVRRVNNYILKKEIGRGSFGVVHLGIDSTTSEEFVCWITDLS
jgi:serine/threonine protein kinase